MGDSTLYRLDQGGTAVSDTHPLPVATTAGPSGITYTDNSVTDATGASQQLLAANTSRKALTIINPSGGTTAWTINPLGTTALDGTPPCFNLNPGDEWSPVKVPTNKITAIGTLHAKLIVLEG